MKAMLTAEVIKISSPTTEIAMRNALFQIFIDLANYPIPHHLHEGEMVAQVDLLFYQHGSLCSPVQMQGRLLASYIDHKLLLSHLRQGL
jgi:hypothetical protein